MPSLKKTFNRAARIFVYSSALTAAGLYVEDRVSDPGYSVWDGMKLSAVNVVANDSCSYAGYDKPVRSDRQKTLLDLYNQASLSDTGKAIMADLKNGETILCFHDGLNKGRSDGLVTVGTYYYGLNLIKLNPGKRWQNMLADTLVHEGRHRQQDGMDFGAFKMGRNYRPSDQMIMNWLTEADARLATILHTYEKMGQGHGGHVLALPSGYRKMARAFLSEMRESQDIQEAMRASVRAFRDQMIFADSYDKSIVEHLEKIGYEFSPGKKADPLLTDENLMKLGQMGQYGNYMNEDLMQFIRESVTMDDYRNMRKRILDEKQSNKKPGFAVITPVPTS